MPQSVTSADEIVENILRQRDLTTEFLDKNFGHKNNANEGLVDNQAFLSAVNLLKHLDSGSSQDTQNRITRQEQYFSHIDEMMKSLRFEDKRSKNESEID